MRQFTDTEIKMAEKAVEIQKKWQPSEADYMYNFAIGAVTHILVDRITDRRRRGHSIPYNEDRFFWLPLEHQLWEMLYGTRDLNDTPAGWAYTFANFCNPIHVIYPMKYSELPSDIKKQEAQRYAQHMKAEKYIKQFSSLWQLLLAFVMHELYQKVWNGEDWIKAN